MNRATKIIIATSVVAIGAMVWFKTKQKEFNQGGYDWRKNLFGYWKRGKYLTEWERATEQEYSKQYKIHEIQDTIFTGA